MSMHPRPDCAAEGSVYSAVAQYKYFLLQFHQDEDLDTPPNAGYLYLSSTIQHHQKVVLRYTAVEYTL